MGTAERHEALSDGGMAHVTAQRDPEAPDRDIPADGGGAPGGRALPAASGGGTAAHGTAAGTGGSSGEAAYENPAEADGSRTAADVGSAETGQESAAREQPYHYRPLWVEEPARRRRLPDPVRTSAVRAVLIIAVTLVQAMVAFLCTMAGSWLAFPMVLSSVASTVVATWGALDVWVTRQVWNQRNGVVSTPSSTARALRRERRRARRQARAAERTQERIRRRGGAGQLSHS
ncbi:hypothetical protein CLM62_37435 [Streptomyces sp. SA15]|uniref:hypothetical protein n=1 Tax=Streptomyces sp. SA15 TaxID=934019 RepID=UPI000BAFA3AB|nr:hypothetical protein [Streptomyces sp. SA15]PAZ11090.1 hypothetical protein CLM62_37435 [Streptomyces sp. SA15]